MNLLEAILNAQNGDVVRQMSNQFQLDEGQARSAVGALVPALTQGISKNAGSSQGLESLLGALAGGTHSQYLDNPSALTEPAAVDDGNGILGHIFGSKDVSRAVASNAAERSGVDDGILKKMLPMLATAAMGALAKNGFGAGGSAPNQLPSGGDGGIGGLLSGFLDADKDGSIIDDVLGMAGKFMR
jgi:hypothetical protein